MAAKIEEAVAGGTIAIVAYNYYIRNQKPTPNSRSARAQVVDIAVNLGYETSASLLCSIKAKLSSRVIKLN